MQLISSKWYIYIYIYIYIWAIGNSFFFQKRSNFITTYITLENMLNFKIHIPDLDTVRFCFRVRLANLPRGGQNKCWNLLWNINCRLRLFQELSTRNVLRCHATILSTSQKRSVSYWCHYLLKHKYLKEKQFLRSRWENRQSCKHLSNCCLFFNSLFHCISCLLLNVLLCVMTRYKFIPQ